jgi:hypothetical protein
MNASKDSNIKKPNTWDLVTNNSMNILILFGLIFSGIFIKVFLGNNNSANGGQASSTIWGYGLTIISLFTLMFIVISKDLNNNTNSILNLILTRGLSIFILIMILVYIVNLSINYYDIINKNFVPVEYNTYSTISTMLIVIQILLVYQISSILLKNRNLNTGKSDIDITLSRLTSITWIFSALNFILAIIMNIILEFFVTDG